MIDNITNDKVNISWENLSYFWNSLKPYIAEQVSFGGVTIDSEMSDTSENAVQNKVVKAYVDNAIGDIQTVLSSVVEVI